MWRNSGVHRSATSVVSTMYLLLRLGYQMALVLGQYSCLALKSKTAVHCNKKQWKGSHIIYFDL